MASWKDERDRLVAQTRAFVQSVAAANPDVARQLEVLQPGIARQPTEPGPGDDAIRTSPASASDVCLAVQPSEAEASPDADMAPQTDLDQPAIGPAASTVARMPREPLYSVLSERDDILRRVAAFKARQSETTRDREAYYDRVQSQIRTKLRNQSEEDRL